MQLVLMLWKSNSACWSSTKLISSSSHRKCSLFSRYENPTQRVGLVQSWYHHRLIENVTCSPHDIAEKLLICVNQQSLTHSNHTSYRILYHLWQIVMPWYNWNTVESGVKQHNPDRSLTSTSIKNIVSATVFFLHLNIVTRNTGMSDTSKWGIFSSVDTCISK